MLGSLSRQAKRHHLVRRHRSTCSMTSVIAAHTGSSMGLTSVSASAPTTAVRDTKTNNPTVLLVYGSVDGHTGKIAAYLSDRLMEHGYATQLLDIEEQAHGGRYISADPANYVAVVGAASTVDHDATMATEETIVTDMFTQTNFRPQVWHVLAGALKFSQYGWFVKRLMQWIAAKRSANHSVVDTSHDYELTDWKAVNNFAEEVHELLQRGGVSNASNVGYIE